MKAANKSNKLKRMHMMWLFLNPPGLYNHTCEPGKQKRTWFTKDSDGQWAGNSRLEVTVTWLGGLLNSSTFFQALQTWNYLSWSHEKNSNLNFQIDQTFTTCAIHPTHFSISWPLDTISTHSFLLFLPYGKPHPRLHDLDSESHMCLFFLIWSVKYKNKCA